MAGRLSQATIEDLLSRIDIIEIIQPRLSLTKKGANYQALCPFHQEKTPSFTVSQKKQFYYCFGCGTSGNAIHFLMNYDRMEFMDVMTYLAAQAGMDLSPETFSTPDPQRQSLYPLLEKIALIYQKNLKQSQEAIQYLKKRGLTGKTAKQFAIGYATSSWDQISQQFDTASLISAGMTIRNDAGKMYDRFRHRILFPIRDIRGRVIAFGGRNLNNELPKYLNSPETPIFHKSNELYGLYEARKAEKELTRLLIVEGYMDVVALAEHGIPYAVATLGTAINQKHIQKALRYTNELVFCFDGDDAGKQAAWKALTMAMPLLRDGIHFKFMFLPEKEDPDSLIQKIKKESFEQHIDQAYSLSDVFFKTLSEQYTIHSMDAKAQYIHHALQYINTIPQGIFYQLMRKELANRLHINFNELDNFHKTEGVKKTTTINNKGLNSAQLATALLLQQPSLAQAITDIQFLNTLDIPGKALLTDLLVRFQSQPGLTTGSLLASPLPTDQRETITALAAVEFPLSDKELLIEFQGSLKRLRELASKQQLEALIQKAKSQELSAIEKKTLSELLSHKVKPNVEGT